MVTGTATMTMQTVSAPKAMVCRPAIPYGAAAITVLLGFAAAHLARPVPAFPLDDPYLTLHSAQVLHQGFDPNYPGTSPLFGVTSAPFLGLVWLLLFMLPPLIAVDLACWLGILAYVLGLVAMARAAGMNARDGGFLVVLGCCISYVPFHLVNGLETSWALAGVTWTLVWATQNARGWAALAAGATACIRPDLILFSLCIMVALWLERRDGKGLFLAGLCATPIALCALWYWHGTGLPFPQTGLAKRYFFAQDLQPWPEKLMMEGLGLSGFMLSLGVSCCAIGPLRRSSLGRAMLAFLVLFLASIYQQFPGALTWNYYRYPIVLVPVLLWGLAYGWNGAGRRRKQGLLYASLLYAAFSLVLVVWPRYLRETRFYDEGLRSVASWCDAHLPPGSVLLVHDAGYISYATRFHLVDMAGLKTPAAMPWNRQFSWPSGGSDRSKAVSGLALATHAQYLVFLSGWAAASELPDQMQALGWRLEPMRAAATYQVFRLTPPR